MRAFAGTWKRNEIVQAQLAQLPWYHQIVSTYNLGLPPRPQLEAKLSAALADGKIEKGETK